jgi:hypothetical protein
VLSVQVTVSESFSLSVPEPVKPTSWPLTGEQPLSKSLVCVSAKYGAEVFMGEHKGDHEFTERKGCIRHFLSYSCSWFKLLCAIYKQPLKNDFKRRTAVLTLN